MNWLNASEPGSGTLMSADNMLRLPFQPGEFARLPVRLDVAKIKVLSGRNVHENMIFMPFCYTEAAATLFIDSARGPLGKRPEIRFCAVQQAGWADIPGAVD